MTKWKAPILAVLLILVTFFAYLPALHGEMIWDDDVHIPVKPELQTNEGLRNMWLKIGTTPQYYPLTHTTLWLEWKLVGKETFLYHMDNILLHITASLLIVLLLKRLELPGAWLAGFIFALHPLHVESVAWISERKNTLSIVFALLTLIAYPGLRLNMPLKSGAFRRMLFVSFGFFVLAILSKTVICTLPAVMLVIIWWKRGKIVRTDLIPLIPFFLLSILASILTSRMEKEVVRAIGADWDMSFLQRLHIAGKAIWWYAGKVFYPGEPAFSYSRWNPVPDSWIDWIPVISAVALLVLAIVLHKRIGRGLAAMLLIFGGMLFPALSFFNLYPHRYSFVADHFQYHANVAMIAFGSAVLINLCRQIDRRAWIAPTVLIISFFTIQTYRQSQIYQDAETLWKDTIVKTPDSWLAHISYADEIVKKYNDPIHLNQSVQSYEQARKLRPQMDQPARALGMLYSRLGRIDDAGLALQDAEKILLDQIKSDTDVFRASKSRMRLGDLYEVTGQFDRAISVYIQADQSLPESEVFKGKIVKLYINQARYQDAIPWVEKIYNRHPGEIDFIALLADCYYKSGQYESMRKLLNNVPADHANDPRITALKEKIR